MKRILRFEMIKIANPITWIYWGLFFMVFSAFCVHEPKFFTEIFKAGFIYDEDRISFSLDFASYYKYSIAIFIMFITCREFEKNTISRAIYEGFSKIELFSGKIVLLIIITLLVLILTRSILFVVFILRGYSVHAVFFMLFNFHFIVAELFSCFFLGMLGLMLSLLIKNPYWAIGLFISLAFLEFLITFSLMLTTYIGLMNFFPIGGMVNIIEKMTVEEMGPLALIYFFSLQLLFMVIIYKQYQNLKWLRKR